MSVFCEVCGRVHGCTVCPNCGGLHGHLRPGFGVQSDGPTNRDDGCSGLHLARKGEAVYVSIQRERSGQMAGELDFNIACERVVALTEHEFGALLELLAAAARSCQDARKPDGDGKCKFCGCVPHPGENCKEREE